MDFWATSESEDRSCIPLSPDPNQFNSFTKEFAPNVYAYEYSKSEPGFASSSLRSVDTDGVDFDERPYIPSTLSVIPKSLDSGLQDGRTHKCTICGHRFVSPKALNRHVLACHNPARPFVCPAKACESFKRKDHLVRHMKNKHAYDADFIGYYVQSLQTQQAISDFAKKTVDQVSPLRHKEASLSPDAAKDDKARGLRSRVQKHNHKLESHLSSERSQEVVSERATEAGADTNCGDDRKEDEQTFTVEPPTAAENKQVNEPFNQLIHAMAQTHVASSTSGTEGLFQDIKDTLDIPGAMPVASIHQNAVVSQLSAPPEIASESETQSENDTPPSSVETSDTSDDSSLDDDGSTAESLPTAPKTPKDMVISCLTEFLRSWLHARLRQCQSGSPDGDTTAAAPPGSSSSNGLRAQPQRSAGDVARGKRPRGRDDDGNGDEPSQKRLKRMPTDKADAEGRLLFACPFHKRRPKLYSGPKWKSCREPSASWCEVHRVKEHLFRMHLLRPQCPRCRIEFDSTSELEEHHQKEVPCARQDAVYREGIGEQTQRKLKSGKGCMGMLPHDKWIHWYKILFSTDDLAFMPSPYHEVQPQTCGPVEDYMRYEFVDDVQRELVRLIPQEIASIMPRLVDVIRAACIAVYTRFQERQGMVRRDCADLPGPEPGIPNISDDRDTTQPFITNANVGNIGLLDEADLSDCPAWNGMGLGGLDSLGDSILHGDFVQQTIDANLSLQDLQSDPLFGTYNGGTHLNFGGDNAAAQSWQQL